MHNEELRDFYSCAVSIKMNESRRMRWAVHVARMVKMRNRYKILI